MVGNQYGIGEVRIARKNTITKQIYLDGYIAHKGIEKYFTDDGFKVVNLCKYGATNDEIYQQLRKIFVEFDRDPETKKIIYPKYIAFNPIYGPERIKDENVKYYRYESYKKLEEDWINYYYTQDLEPQDKNKYWADRLVHWSLTPDYDKRDLTVLWFQNENENLQETYKTINNIKFPIYCIGACSPLDMNIIGNYEYLNPIIPDATEILKENKKNFISEPFPNSKGYKVLYDLIRTKLNN